MSKIKRNIIGLLFGLSLICICLSMVGGFSLITSDADAVAKFAMSDGAAIRLLGSDDDYAGVRWETTVNKTFYDSLTINEGDQIEFGVVVAPKKKIVADNAPLTDKTTSVKIIPCTREVEYDENNEFVYYSSIVFNKEWDAAKLNAAYGVELTARAYVKINGEYTFTDEYDTTRSMRAVALESLNHGFTQEEVGGYFGLISEDTTMSGYYDAQESTAVLENVNQLNVGTYAASVNAQPVEVNVNSDSTVTLTGNVKGLAAGNDYKLNVFDTDNNVYIQKFKCVTLIIREASDLEIFHVKKAWNDKFTESEIFDGYYLLGNDIDCAGYIYGGVDANGVQNQNVISAWSSSNQFNGYGLTGTFDGNGHTIKNLTTSGAGLFFAISGGTVKDLNLRGNIAKNKSGDNSGFFAGYLFDATVSNVNIDCTRSGRWAQMPLANRIINSSLSNIVVTVNGNTSGGGDGIVSYLKNTNAENTNVFTDCYVVSDKTIANSNANNRYDAKYVNGVAVEGGLDGIKRYTTADEFLADKDNNDYSSFNADVWDTSSGMPLWKNN